MFIDALKAFIDAVWAIKLELKAFKSASVANVLSKLELNASKFTNLVLTDPESIIADAV